VDLLSPQPPQHLLRRNKPRRRRKRKKRRRKLPPHPPKRRKRIWIWEISSADLYDLWQITSKSSYNPQITRLSSNLPPSRSALRWEEEVSPFAWFSFCS
jgi:hypothetical protein